MHRRMGKARTNNGKAELQRTTVPNYWASKWGLSPYWFGCGRPTVSRLGLSEVRYFDKRLLNLKL